MAHYIAPADSGDDAHICDICGRARPHCVSLDISAELQPEDVGYPRTLYICPGCMNPHANGVARR